MLSCATMAITITAPEPRAIYRGDDASEDEDPYDPEGDLQMAGIFGTGRKRSTRSIVSPGEAITNDPQWMRYEII